ncbi:MAG: class I SAM-dependent methyltransferase, partial [Ruminiclostridium sp.]|nr:class I SAM-dependent methyltransferase [Ruminiclostridium sp.]
MKENMTALVSSFARAWHTEHTLLPVHRDTLARQLLGSDYDVIARHMAQGIDYFCPDFSGSEDESLAHIVTRHLAPTPLGRGAFWEDSLRTAVPLGTTQVLLLGAGYDTFPYRQPDWAQDLT